MKTNYLVKSAALAALFAAAISAHAAGIPINTGDLILGFQDSSNSIQFNMGNISTLTAASGTVDLGFNVNTALSYTGSGTTGYGAGWAGNSGIVWDVIGKDANNFYTGMAQTSPLSTLAGGPAAPNSTLVIAGDTTAAQQAISPMFTTMSGNMAPSTQLKAGGSTILAAKYANSNTASMNKIDPNTVAAAFGNTFQNSTLLNTNVTTTVTGTTGLLNGLTYSSLDLYSFQGPAGAVTESFLGTLSLTSGGELFFTSVGQAIPEPSTYALILGVATLGFAAIRRRKQVSALV